MPSTFKCNRGQVDIQVSSQNGENVLTQWIQVMGNSEVIAQAGENADKPKYVVSLFLPADYSQCPTSPLPQWFIKLLQSRGGPYHTLAEVARALEHPTAYAEVKCYCCHHERHAELEVNRRAIIAEMEQEDDALSSIEHHMEGWGIHECLAHLEGHLDIH